MATAAAAEHSDKLARLVRLAGDAGVGGVLLATHHNVAWLTGGAANCIDASREAGSARLFVTADGRRFVLANAIEMPRLLDEELTGLGYEPVEYSWTDDQDPGHAVRTARELLTGDLRIGADWPLPDTTLLEASIARIRAPLTDAEIARYRALGAEAGRVMAHVCRELSPGDDERNIARAIIDGAASIRARAIVSLVGSDDRLRRYRHPVATAASWRHVVMLALCAERHGLVVSLSRIVAAGAPADLTAKTQATAAVFGRLLATTRAGVTGAELYRTAAEAYAAAGFPGEERKHHQGGAIGYRAREWVAHPHSQEVVQARQAFAWNPTITGTKIEDTALLLDGRIEIITASPDWPAIPLDAGVAASDVWQM
jgi:Xaa-Pro aminopeptidase